MSSGNNTIGRNAFVQRDGEPRRMEMVTVACMLPDLPPGIASPTGVGAAGVFGWDESINWAVSNPHEKQQTSSSKKFLRKIGLTTQRQKANPDAPPYRFRTVPYETWRKHYAKDAQGNYHGTHAPAEDCILKPDDVARWRLEEPVTLMDRFTRGKEALPVYAEVQADERVPDYEVDAGSYHHPPPVAPLVPAYTGVPPPSVTRMEEMMRTSNPVVPAYAGVPPPLVMGMPETRRTSSSVMGMPLSPSVSTGSTGIKIADGKTAQEIIEEAKVRAAEARANRSRRDRFQRGLTIGLMGNVA